MKAKPATLVATGAALLSISIFAATGAGSCHPTSSQIESTFVDGAKAGACVLALALGGQVDANVIVSRCSGATLAFIVDVIDDYEAHQADAGTSLAMTSAEQRWLDTAKQNAVAQLARKAPGK